MISPRSGKEVFYTFLGLRVVVRFFSFFTASKQPQQTMNALKLFNKLRAHSTVLTPGALFQCGPRTSAPSIFFHGCGDIPVQEWMLNRDRRKRFGEVAEAAPVFHCHYLTFDECNKNFVYYWFFPFIFPQTRLVFLNSHPCDPDVFRRVSELGPGARMYVADWWMDQAQRYCPRLVGQTIFSLEQDEVPDDLLPNFKNQEIE